MSEVGEALNSSMLGTKAYWDAAYDRELENFDADHEDHGTNWFEESAAEDKVIAFLTEKLELPPSTSFLDLGTGNGEMLHRLLDEGFTGKMVGVDYSEKSIALAKEISGKRDGEKPEFIVWDIMNDSMRDPLMGGFDMVLDKGTFDAISLSDAQVTGRRLYELYPGKVVPLIKPGGLLIITSCNWTSEEIVRHFNVPGLQPYPIGITYPSYSFAGQTGQTICTKVFKRL